MSVFDLCVCVVASSHSVREINYPESSTAAGTMTKVTFQSQNLEQTEPVKPNLEQRQSDCLFSTLTKSDEKRLFLIRSSC